MRNIGLYILVSLIFCISEIGKISASILITNGLTHEFSVNPGGKSGGTVHLLNNSDQPRTVRLFQTDYKFTYTGESSYDQPGTSDRSNAGWITISQSFVTLQAREERQVAFGLTVPEKTGLIGTYWSVIMVEGVPDLNPDAASAGIRINTVLRYAVQIVTHIGDSGERNLVFRDLSVVEEDGEVLLAVILENQGERGLRPFLSLELIDEYGHSLGLRRTDPKRIYPGTSLTYTIPLDGVNPGNYMGVLIADGDDDYVFGTNLSLEL